MTSPTTRTCSCGEREAHEIARRMTSDGIAVVLWSDGDITGRMGIRLRGLGRPQSRDIGGLLRAGWLAIGEVELYTSEDVSRLVRTARKAIYQTALPLPGYLRAEMAR